MQILFLENHDSFSWNVIDSLPCDRSDITIVSLHPSLTVNHPDRVEEKLPGGELGPKERMRLEFERFDALVIGPGPTDPIRAGLVEIVREAARNRLPTLGICLGYQAVGLAFGAKLIRTEPCHGKRSQITFRPNRMFAPFNGTHTVMRYHSLSLSDIVSPLRQIAETEDHIPMAIEHESLPIAGLQFHPDSYATDSGREMIAAFFAKL